MDQEIQQNQEEQPQTGQQNQEEQDTTQVEPEKLNGSKNTIIIAVIAVIVVVLALMYMWGAQVEKNLEEPVTTIPEPPLLDEQTAALRQVSASDEIDAIEADLGATKLDNLDEGVTQLESEIDAALQE